MWERFQVHLWNMMAIFGLMIAVFIWVREGFIHNHAILILFFSAFAWTMSFSAARKLKLMKRYEEDENKKWEEFKRKEAEEGND